MNSTAEILESLVFAADQLRDDAASLLRSFTAGDGTWDDPENEQEYRQLIFHYAQLLKHSESVARVLRRQERAARRAIEN